MLEYSVNYQDDTPMARFPSSTVWSLLFNASHSISTDITDSVCTFSASELIFPNVFFGDFFLIALPLSLFGVVLAIWILSEQCTHLYTRLNTYIHRSWVMDFSLLTVVSWKIKIVTFTVKQYRLLYFSCASFSLAVYFSFSFSLVLFLLFNDSSLVMEKDLKTVNGPVKKRWKNTLVSQIAFLLFYKRVQEKKTKTICEQYKCSNVFIHEKRSSRFICLSELQFSLLIRSI